MTNLYSYRKGLKELQLVDVDVDDYKEVATVDGVTYVAVRDGVKDPATMDKKIDLRPVTPALLGSAAYRAIIQSVISAMPETKAINDTVVNRIRERYSVADEIKMLRIAPSRETEAWNDYVESCLEWGRKEKGKFGLKDRNSDANYE